MLLWIDISMSSRFFVTQRIFYSNHSPREPDAARLGTRLITDYNTMTRALDAKIQEFKSKEGVLLPPAVIVERSHVLPIPPNVETMGSAVLIQKLHEIEQTNNEIRQAEHEDATVASEKQGYINRRNLLMSYIQPILTEISQIDGLTLSMYCDIFLQIITNPDDHTAMCANINWIRAEMRRLDDIINSHFGRASQIQKETP